MPRLKKIYRIKTAAFSLMFGFLLVVFSLASMKIAQAANGSLTLMSSAPSVSTGGSFYVDVAIDTNSNNIVVARAVIRYDKLKVSFVNWDTSTSIFATNSNKCFLDDGGVSKPANSPCQIITNDTVNGIVSITMASSHDVPVNGAGLEVARANFTAVTDLATDPVDASTGVMGLHYAVTRNGNDSGIILDDGNASDVTNEPTQRSTAQFGDLNSDRTINGADFSLLHTNYDNNIAGNVADINADNSVNGADFSLLHANFGSNH